MEHLTRLVEWAANCQITTNDDTVTVEQAGLVVSAQELEEGQTVTFNINVEKVGAYTPSAEGVESEEDYIYHELQDKSTDKEITQYYEITMSKAVDGEETPITSVYKDTDTTGKFRITMEIPEEYRGHRHYSFLHVHCGEVVELTDLDDDPYTVTFEVDRFSTFALAYTDVMLTEGVTSLEVCLKDGSTYIPANSADAVAKHLAQAGSYIRLLEDGVTLEIPAKKTVYIDINGKTANITGSGTLCGMDSGNDSYQQSTGAVSVAETEKVQKVVSKGPNGHRYIAEIREDGTAMFHRYEMELTDLVVNTIQCGITYKSSFGGDQFVQSQIKEFGIAMRAYNAPNQTSIWSDPDCKTHVALTKDQWTNNAIKSVYVSNIIDPTQSAANNAARTQVAIYGRAYIQLDDGTMLFGDATSFSMKSAVEHVDSWWDGLGDESRERLVTFYTNPAYKPFMESWEIPNIKAAAGESK